MNGNRAGFPSQSLTESAELLFTCQVPLHGQCLEQQDSLAGCSGASSNPPVCIEKLRAPLSLQQVDPLIRELVYYRDLIQKQVNEQEKQGSLFPTTNEELTKTPPEQREWQ